MSKIEAVLRNACALAVNPAFSLPDAISLYRSVATLARALRLEMADNGLPRGFAPDLVVLMIGVLNNICGRALAPGATPAVTANLSRAIGQMAAACHQARPVAEKPPKQAPAPAPEPKPVVVQAAKPAPARPMPAKPVAPKDQALIDTLMADISRRAIQDYKRAA